MTIDGAGIAAIIMAIATLYGTIKGAKGIGRARLNRRREAAQAEMAEAEAKKAAVDAALAPINATLEAQSRLISDMGGRIDDLEEQLRDERAECDRALAAQREELERLRATVELHHRESR